jgi:hypothetical protein
MLPSPTPRHEARGYPPGGGCKPILPAPTISNPTDQAREPQATIASPSAERRKEAKPWVS